VDPGSIESFQKDVSGDSFCEMQIRSAQMHISSEVTKEHQLYLPKNIAIACAINTDRKEDGGESDDAENRSEKRNEPGH
jgi:hypothetical protein